MNTDVGLVVCLQVLFLGYAWRWTQSKDPMYTERALAAERCPITKQGLVFEIFAAALFELRDGCSA